MSDEKKKKELSEKELKDAAGGMSNEWGGEEREAPPKQKPDDVHNDG